MTEASRRSGPTESLRVLHGGLQGDDGEAARAGDPPSPAGTTPEHGPEPRPEPMLEGAARSVGPDEAERGSERVEAGVAGSGTQGAEASSGGPSETTPDAPSEPEPEAPAGAPASPPAGLSPGASVRAAARPATRRSVPAVPDFDGAWAALPVLPINPRHLRRQLVVTAQRTDPAHGAFDVLRTRVLGEMQRRGWRRLGITSPTQGCGKTFTAVNLAVTMSRLVDVRTLLLDLDLRRPAVARVLGATKPGAIGDFLRGLVPPEAALARVGPNSLQVGYLALGVNARPEPYAAEIFRHARMGEALRAAEARLGPDLTILDLPPALAQDDVLALRPHYDALLLVAGGGQTTPRELKEAARRLGPDAPILGVVLNKAEGEGIDDYAYDYR